MWTTTTEYERSLPLRADPGIFEWTTWCAGTIHELGLECRYHDITSALGRELLRKHVIAYCPGEQLYCRPKAGEVAVMVLVGDREFWFHITKREFAAVFPELETR